MTREEMLEEILKSWGPPYPEPDYSPFYDDEWLNIDLKFWNDWDTKRYTWASQAPLDWLDVLIDLIIRPPDWTPYRKRFEDALTYDNFGQEIFDAQAELILAEWVVAKPEEALAKIGPWVGCRQDRNVFLKAIAQLPTNDPKTRIPNTIRKNKLLPLFKPLVEDAPQRTEEENLWLAITLGYMGVPEAVELLTQLKLIVPTNSLNVHEQIEKSILNQHYYH